MAKCARVMVFDSSGTPLKPFEVEQSRAVCKKCGAAIRWAKERAVGIRFAVDEAVYIARPVQGYGLDKSRFMTRSGRMFVGEAQELWEPGCRIASRLHKCDNRNNDIPARVKLLPGGKRRY